MATQGLVEIFLRAQDQASGAIGRVKGALIGLTAALGGAFLAIKNLTGYYSQSQIAHVKLTTALKNLGYQSGKTAELLEQQAASLQQLTGVEDDEIINAQALLATFGLSATAIQQLTPRILDMAAAHASLSGGQIDVRTTAMAVAKAMENGIAILRRYGVAVTDTQIKEFDLMNTQQRLEMINGLLKKSYDGMAEAIGATFQGRLNSLNNAFGDMKEIAGELLVRVLTPFVVMLQELSNWFRNLDSDTQKWIIGIGLGASAIATLASAGAALLLVFSALGTALASSGAIMVGVLALQAAAVGLAGVLGFRVGQAINDLITNKFPQLSGAINTLIAELFGLDRGLKTQLDTTEKTAGALDKLRVGMEKMAEGSKGVNQVENAIKNLGLETLTASARFDFLRDSTMTNAEKMAELKSIVDGMTLATQKQGEAVQTLNVIETDYAAQKTARFDKELEEVYAMSLAKQEADNQRLLATGLMTAEEIKNAETVKTSKINSFYALLGPWKKVSADLTNTEMQALAARRQGLQNFWSFMLAGAQQNQGKQKNIYKAFAIAQATIDTYSAAVGAYKAMAGIPLVGPVLGGIAAAAAVAMGMQNVGRIRAMEEGGIIPGSHGGQLILAGENGRSEAIVPLQQSGGGGLGGGNTYIFNGPVLDHAKLIEMIDSGLSESARRGRSAFADRLESGN